MRVIGTAGHVDHGKSTLVKAMTGMDPDRLLAEQERGLTIDLGFAWMTMANGEEVSIVDVPGHESFVSNMLAGVGSIDMALLLVAADESVMPQTREHLAILDLLQIKRGIIVITKSDLVDAEMVELVSAEMEEALQGTSLEGVRTLAVSAETGAGMPDLLRSIQDVLTDTRPKKDLGRPRLPVDRSFTISGFGTVVTGTLVDGPLKVGQEVELLPGARRARVRGLQTNKSKLDEANPGRRLAVNLSGVGHDDVRRGDVLATPGWLQETSAIDVHFRAVAILPRPIKHNLTVSVHTGSSHVMGKLRLLDIDKVEPGEWAWAQLKLVEPLVVVRGDYFVVRSSGHTVGGGNVVDPHARRHRRMHPPTVDRLALMEQGSDSDVLLKVIESLEPTGFNEAVHGANLSPGQTQIELQKLVASGLVVSVGQIRTGRTVVFYSMSGWDRLGDKVRKVLAAYHERFPLRSGVPKEEIRSRLGMPTQVFNQALTMFMEQGLLVEDGKVVRLSGHELNLTEDQERAIKEYAHLLRKNPYSPPTDFKLSEDLENVLVDRGEIVRVTDTVVFSRDAYDDMVTKIRVHVSEKEQITVADVRDLFSTTRKYALALMEHLDQQRVTRRVGDARVLR